MFEATFSIVPSEKKIQETVGFVSAVFKFFCYGSNTINFHFALNLLLKIVDFENSMSIAAVNRRHKLPVEIMLSKVDLLHYGLIKKSKRKKKKK